MRILHVLSQLQVTGAETYAISIADMHVDEGHEVFIVSDTLLTPTRGRYIPQPIGDRRYLQRLRNIRFLKNFIKEQQIDVVHAHSRAASWVSYFALLGTKVPLISTVHGRQHLHTSTSLFDIYGDRVIAVCSNLRSHLINEVKMNGEKISVISNGFDFSRLKTCASPQHEGKILSVIGRTTGPKGERTTELLQNVFPSLLRTFPELVINIIGGDIKKLPTVGISSIDKLNREFDNRVRVIGFVSDLPDWICKSDLVIGSGRVAIESLFLEVPTVALGEGCCHGLVNDANFDEVLSSNFGDILAGKERADIDFEGLTGQMTSFFEGKTGSPGRKSQIGRIFDISTVARDVMDIYLSARMKKYLPKHIPVLMYHKIPEAPIETRHRTFITKENFEGHLSFFKKRGFESITFKDYLSFRNCETPLTAFPKRPLILTFDDGYLDNYTNLLPMVKRYGFRGVIFLLGDPSIRYNFWDADSGEHRDELMNLEQKKEFVESGWEIGAHSMTHANLTTLDDEKAYYEIAQSKAGLEKDMGTEIVSFAYPTGYCDERIKELVKKAGIQFGVATDSGGMHLEDDLFQIFRVNIFPDDNAGRMYKKTSSCYRGYYKRKRGR